MNGKIDFEGLAARLLSQAQSLLPQWLPGGRLLGQEWTCGDLKGFGGNSLKINVRTGKWSDFSGTEKGGDLVSLYAAIHGIKNGEAARELGAEFSNTRALVKKSPRAVETFLLPPQNAPALPISPERAWAYCTRQGELIYYQTRSEPKDFRPYSWDGQKWVAKSPPVPRPLYGLEYLDTAPDRPILIVEGEKAADAARLIVGERYLVLTWSNGSNSFAKADWSPIAGRKVLLWPDADPPGLKAMAGIAELLAPHCPEVKLITPPAHLPKGWDAADCGFGWSEFVAWAKPCAKLYNRQVPLPAEPEFAPEPDDESVSSPYPAIRDWSRFSLQLSDKGFPIPNLHNVATVLEQWEESKESLWYDTFHQKIMVKDPKGVRPIGDKDVSRYSRIFQRDFGMARISKNTVNEGIQAFAFANERNEPRDWFEGLTWDGVTRIGTFFPDCFGCEATDYTRAISKNFWVSMVARIYQPGCQADHMVIIEGPQGKLKTTAFRIIGGKWYGSAQGRMGEKDFWQSLHGKLIVEMAELASFNKRDANVIKSEITRTVDNFRIPYLQYNNEFPRQCIFVGTTNEKEYLNDPTGARRFWPIHLGNGPIDIETVKACRDQLFAEAVFKYKAGETHHEVPIEDAEIEQEKRRQYDAWEGGVAEYLNMREQALVLLSEVAEHLNVSFDRLDMKSQWRLGSIMRKLGWESMEARDPSTKINRKYWRLRIV